MSQHSDQDLLRLYLAERDITCPMCTYNLRGLEDEHCPECGETLSLTVRPESYRYGAYITAVVGLAVGTGFFGIVFIWMAITTITDELFFSREEKVGVAAALLVQCVFFAVLIRFNKKFRRADQDLQSLMAIGCWILSSVTAIIFFTNVS